MAKKIKVKRKIGEKWFSMVPPEEFHFWTKKHMWGDEAFRKYGVALVAANVKVVFRN